MPDQSKIRAIIVDDESDARDVLRKMIIAFVSEVEVVADYENPEEAVKGIREYGPDLVFLDIQMPGMSGFKLMEQFPNPSFRVIFVTAFNQYAIRAIRLSALDYLLKPVDIDELTGAVARFQRQSGTDSQQFQALQHNLAQKHRLSLPSEQGLELIDLEDLLYLEADSNYTHLYLTDRKKITVSKTLRVFEEYFEGTNFYRCHYSFIINLSRIKKYMRGEGGSVIMENGVEIPVSRRRKPGLLDGMTNLD
ncbi:MAG: response regulator transcription factor [Bacteroidia bacterium]|nr:response regulator transcription factor [Bacteroidia bacterium]